MGAAVWDCYRYHTLEVPAEQRLAHPPSGVRQWRLEPYARFLDTTCVDLSGALAWLRHHVTDAATYIGDLAPRQAVNIHDVLREAEARLSAQPVACQWAVRLPDGHDLILAVLGRYDTAPGHSPAAPGSRP